MTCSRCASSGPIVASVEIRRGAHSRLHLLCAWCIEAVSFALQPVDLSDYDTLDDADIQSSLAPAPSQRKEYQHDHAA